MHDPLVRQHCALLADATAMVGDAQVRHRGTIGGATAHGDPAGDLPAVVSALDATFVAQGPQGTREIPAADFFHAYLQTALAPDEVLVSVRVPKHDASWGFAYEKFNRVAQAWAVVGVAAAVRRDNGSIAEARIGLTNMGATPGAGHRHRAGPGRCRPHGRRHRRGGGTCRRRHQPARRPVGPARLPPAPGQGADPTGGRAGRGLTSEAQPARRASGRRRRYRRVVGSAASDRPDHRRTAEGSDARGPRRYATPTGEPCPRTVRLDGTIEGSGDCHACGCCLLDSGLV